MGVMINGSSNNFISNLLLQRHLPNGGTVANIEAMWAARSLKFNALAIRNMMKNMFAEDGLESIYNSFTVKNLKGQDLLLKDAEVWEMLNLPIDDAIDLFVNLLKACQTVNKEYTFDALFAKVKNFTLEERGNVDFFESVQADYDQAGIKPHTGRWFVIYLVICELTFSVKVCARVKTLQLG